jgi:hypothetical protein
LPTEFVRAKELIKMLADQYHKEDEKVNDYKK